MTEPEPRGPYPRTRRRYLFGLRPGWTWNDLTHRLRWLRPGVLALAVAFFALPFLAVSCDTPVGWGPRRPDTTTTYSGFDLAFGGVPHRGPDDVGARGGDGLGMLPITTVALLLVAAALAVSALALVVRMRSEAGADPRSRLGHRALRHITTVVTALALVVLLLSEAVAHRSLTEQVTAAVERSPGYEARADYVHVGQGFVLVTALLVLPLLVSLVSVWSRWHATRERARRRSRGRDGRGAEIDAHHPPDDGRRSIGSTWADVTPQSPSSPPGPASRPRRS